jgi:hypothetical protein
MFAKIYETDLGQLLVKIDEGENGAEVRVFFEPEGLGVCSFAMNWVEEDNKTQWEKADNAFDLLTEERTYDLIKDTLGKLYL